MIALKDSNNYLKNKILSNIPRDRVEILGERINDDVLVGLDKSYEAMETLIDVLRSLESKGEIIIERFEY